MTGNVRKSRGSVRNAPGAKILRSGFDNSDLDRSDPENLTGGLSESLSGNLSEIGEPLTPGEIALLDNPADLDGRVSDARAARMLGQVVFRTEELRWTPDLVKARLREAIVTVERVVTRPGPSRKTGFWPSDVAIEWGDQLARLAGGEMARTHSERNRAQVGASEREISRMEQAIRWPAVYLGADALWLEREILQAWLTCEVSTQDWRTVSIAVGGSRRTADRRRLRAFEIICNGLVKDGVLP